MEIIGQAIIWLMMLFVVVGAVGSIIDDTKGVGKEFKEGIYSIGVIFLPVAGIMVLMPYLQNLVTSVLGPAYALLHADPSLAATTILPSDMGGYQLAHATAGSHGAWMMAFATGLTAGATILYSIPVGLAMLDKRDHKYLALGFMSGLLAIPVAVLLTAVMLQITGAPLREEVNTSGASTRPFDLPWSEILLNLLPLAIVTVTLALLLRFFTNVMVRAFIIFGRVLDAIIKLALALAIVDYFTGALTNLLGFAPFAPFIADGEDQFRALEIAGYVGVMLAGAFPLVYTIRTRLATPLSLLGTRLGFSLEGAAGVIAGAVNIQALFRMVRSMPPRDKVMCTAFAVCAAFSLGDHLAFTANFQPNMVAPLVIGKLSGGVIGMVLAVWLSLPYARVLETKDRATGVILPEEYRSAVLSRTGQTPELTQDPELAEAPEPEIAPGIDDPDSPRTPVPQKSGMRQESRV